MRIGISPPSGREKINLEYYVLRPFGKKELKELEKVEKRAEEAVYCWLSKGIERAMSKYNASLFCSS
jgi:peptidyl-tRNA hydrolase